MAGPLGKVEYSQRPDGKWNKWMTEPASKWYVLEEDFILEDVDKWILVDVVEDKGQ